MVNLGLVAQATSLNLLLACHMGSKMCLMGSALRLVLFQIWARSRIFLVSRLSVVQNPREKTNGKGYSNLPTESNSLLGVATAEHDLKEISDMFLSLILVHQVHCFVTLSLSKLHISPWK